ncbi:hypothetical protein CLAIMM_13851 [Cladophialophora immunda]|nr:hypothetical protein CLAIMM_13851 [Cladophialophora immunda]
MSLNLPPWIAGVSMWRGRNSSVAYDLSTPSPSCRSTPLPPQLVMQRRPELPREPVVETFQHAFVRATYGTSPVESVRRSLGCWPKFRGHCPFCWLLAAGQDEVGAVAETTNGRC